jgi:hypothetical protein
MMECSKHPDKSMNSTAIVPTIPFVRGFESTGEPRMACTGQDTTNVLGIAINEDHGTGHGFGVSES